MIVRVAIADDQPLVRDGFRVQLGLRDRAQLVIAAYECGLITPGGVVDDRPATLRFAAGRLRQEPGAAPGAELIIRTTSAFLDRWAAGDASWEDGRASGEVITEGPPKRGLAGWPPPDTCSASNRRRPMPDHHDPAGFFWQAGAPALAHDDVAAGTMMGLPCLRVSGAFFASCDHRTGDLIVKLPRRRVEQLIDAGAGKPFAPAGRTFRQWVLIDDRDQARWAGLIDEARLFVAGHQ